MRNKKKFIGIIVLSALLVLAIAQITSAAVGVDSEALRDAVTVAGIQEHRAALQGIADAYGGTRQAGTAGYDASAAYIAAAAEAAGYEVTIQEFDFQAFSQLGPSTLEQVAPAAVTYVEETDYNLLSETDPGDVSGPVAAVDLDLGPGNSSSSGCEADDFIGFPGTNDHIALIQRGVCTFQLKAENAANAGAIGAIIFNQGNTADRMGLINATLSAGYSGGIPVFFATYDRGVEWSGTTGLELHMIADVFRGTVTTSNVIADSPGGRGNRVVVVGAHLDSVQAGPGINDNGSGSAAILEIAEQMAELDISNRNKIRFAWWGAEESGLVGSTFYVNNLSKRELKDIALNLNFDMIGSPNFVRFVYDGDGSATGIPGPNGSGNVEQVFLDYFASQNLLVEPTVMGTRSDHAAFAISGIPAGGLFTGAEGIKTAQEVIDYGGTAGDQYDPCYHLACDTFANLSSTALDQMSDAAAHAVLTFAMTTSSVNGTDQASDKAVDNHGDEWLGSMLSR